MLDEMLAQLHCYDDRIYFELSTSAATNELILTASGNVAVFPAVDAFVAAAPRIDGWAIVALKPAMGFAFTYRDNEIELDVSQLWFLPLRSASDPQDLGVRLAVPDADLILQRQSVDTAYTILETGIGERSCANDIQHVEITDLPEGFLAQGYLELPRLAEYVEWHKRKAAKYQIDARETSAQSTLNPKSTPRSP